MPLSLNSRILVAAGVVLVAFLGTASFAIDRSFRATALTAVHERLKAQIAGQVEASGLAAPDFTGANAGH